MGYARTVTGSFRAHRLVLCASSAFMRAAFLGELKESETGSVTLSDVSAAVFEAALSWMYEGICLVEAALLPDLLQLALRLQVALLISEVEGLVVARIAANNAFGAWVLGDMHSRPAIVEAAKKVALASFAEATQAEEFAAISAPWLAELLGSDDLTISTEADAFAALQRWHAAQRPPPDNAVVCTLLSCIRWAHAHATCTCHMPHAHATCYMDMHRCARCSRASAGLGWTASTYASTSMRIRWSSQTL